MIELKGVTKVFDTHTAVDDLSLVVQKGSIFGLLGPNGAGKTTTMKMMVGLERATSGTILVGSGEPTVRIVRERIGFMPESPHFYDHLTGIEFLRLCGELFHTQRIPESHYNDLLKQVGIHEAKDHMIHTYSKGMKQRLAFAQAIVNDPDYIFLDEPLDGLDPIGRLELKAVIRSLNERGKTFFFNSHILFDTEELCDNIGILLRGTLLYSGEVESFTKGKTLEEQFVTTIKRESKSL